MSAAAIERITASVLARTHRIRSEEDGLALLRELVVGLARQAADHLYLKVTSEPGWTTEAASKLGDTIIEGHCLSIADSVHAFGGTVEMACDLAERSVIAFGERLRDLNVAPKMGGAA